MEGAIRPLFIFTDDGKTNKSIVTLTPTSVTDDKQTRNPYPLEARIGHKVAMEARHQGLLLRPIGNVMVLMPPLNTSLPELRRMVEILRECP